MFGVVVGICVFVCVCVCSQERVKCFLFTAHCFYLRGCLTIITPPNAFWEMRDRGGGGEGGVFWITTIIASIIRYKKELERRQSAPVVRHSGVTARCVQVIRWYLFCALEVDVFVDVYSI